MIVKRTELLSRMIDRRDKVIAEKDKVIAEKDKVIAELEAGLDAVRASCREQAERN